MADVRKSAGTDWQDWLSAIQTIRFFNGIDPNIPVDYQALQAHFDADLSPLEAYQKDQPKGGTNADS